MLTINLEREACCSADDQVGVLTMSLTLPDEATVRDLAQRVDDSRFLQFSSSHHTLRATAASRPLFEVHDARGGDQRLQFLTDANTPLRAYGLVNEVRFRFVFD